MDWKAWHDAYDVPDSLPARPLAVVRRQVCAALDRSPRGPLRAVSLCAGQGRDLLEVLSDHPRRADVHARLVELDAANAAFARETAAAAGLERVEVVTVNHPVRPRPRTEIDKDLDVALVYAQYPRVVRMNEQSGRVHVRAAPDHAR